jgi:hypothetical protein
MCRSCGTGFNLTFLAWPKWSRPSIGLAPVEGTTGQLRSPPTKALHRDKPDGNRFSLTLIAAVTCESSIISHDSQFPGHGKLGLFKTDKTGDVIDVNDGA